VVCELFALLIKGNNN